MINNRTNKPGCESGCRPEKEKGDMSEVTAMLDILRIKPRYFQELLGVDVHSLNRLTDDLPICLWIHDEYHSILYGNKHFLENYGCCVKKTCYQYLMGERKPCSCCLTRRSLVEKRVQSCKFCKRNELGYELNSFHTPVTNKNGDRFILTSSFHVNDVESFYDIYSDRTKAKRVPEVGTGEHTRGTFQWGFYSGESTRESWSKTEY